MMSPMTRTYHAILKAGHVVWIGEGLDDENPVKVTIEVAETPPLPPGGNGAEVARRMEEFAKIGGHPAIADPVAWQREQRDDRQLPGSER